VFVAEKRKAIRIAIGESLWTRAIVDGTVKVEGFPVEFHSKVTLPDRLHGVREGKWDGSDGTLPDYLLEKEQNVGVAKVALPIFMLGGFRQRTLLMRRGGLSPKDLKGKEIALPRVLTPGGVYMRGYLADELGISRDAVDWYTIHGAAEDAEVPWLKGRFNQPEGLEPVRDAADKLSRGEIDALIHPGAHGFAALYGGDKMIEGTLQRFPDLFQPLGIAEEIIDWFKRSKIYPIVHCLQVRADCLDENKGLAEALLDAFKRAWAESEKRLDAREKELIKNERELLVFDAYKYELGDVQAHTIEKLMDYLQADGLLKGRFSLKEIFPN
jgi:4,5-dihydroxyphthalate decarboxylase